MHAEEIDEIFGVDLISHFAIDLSEEVLFVELAGAEEAVAEVLELSGGRGTSSWE
jgi:hypothetical protein